MAIFKRNVIQVWNLRHDCCFSDLFEFVSGFFSPLVCQSYGVCSNTWRLVPHSWGSVFTMWNSHVPLFLLMLLHCFLPLIWDPSQIPSLSNLEETTKLIFGLRGTKELHMLGSCWDAVTSVCSLTPGESKTEPITNRAAILGPRLHSSLICWHEWLHQSRRLWCKRVSNTYH